MNCDGFLFRHLLLLIGITGETGELVLESGNNIGSVIFHRGSVIQAFSPYSRAIGDLLVEEGMITETELLEMLQVQRQEGDFLIGSMFVKAGKVSFEVIESMVREQIRSALREFSGWPGLHASFFQNELLPFDRIHLPVHEFLMPEDLELIAGFLAETKKVTGANRVAPVQFPSA